jgi:hypothetical protein
MRTPILPIALLTALTVSAGCSRTDNSGAAGNGSDTAAMTSMSKPAATAEITERAADSLQGVGVPRAVADVGTHGEDLFDQVKASNWARARVIMDSLDRSASALTPSEQGQLSGVLDTLHMAVAARQRNVAIEAANQVTFIGARLTEAYHPKMPADIVRLDYYGRELEIRAAQKNMSTLASTAADLRRTWGTAKPDVISHGGAAAAARTDSLVARLAAAKSPADYARIATPLLDVVDELEKPFEK